MVMIVVTGGSGFIGSHLVERLVNDGYDVKVVDIKRPQRDVQFANLDILDFEALKEATKGAEAIYHLAGADIYQAYNDPLSTVRLNVIGTANVLEAARLNRVDRIVFASTIFLSANYEGHLYTSTKRAAEDLCRNYQDLYGQKIVVLRYDSVYGPRMPEDSLVFLFVSRAVCGLPLTIYGDGNQYRKFVHIDDLSEGNVLALKKGDGKTLNLSGDEKITVKDVAEKVLQITGSNSKIVYREGRVRDYRGVDIQNEDAKNELGWKPKISFDEGIRKYVEWFIDHD